jgi:hypothetical protein
MYAGGDAEAPARRVALHLWHISIATKRSAAILVVCTGTWLGCTPSSGTGSGQLTITPGEAATAFTPEQAAALDFGLTASVRLQLLFDREVRAISRTDLNPSRAMSNAAQGRAPWFRPVRALR